MLTVTQKAGVLMTQATGQPKIALLAETETRFYYEAFGVQIDFIRDDVGKVTKLILSQMGQKMEAPKIK